MCGLTQDAALAFFWSPRDPAATSLVLRSASPYSGSRAQAGRGLSCPRGMKGRVAVSGARRRFPDAGCIQSYKRGRVN